MAAYRGFIYALCVMGGLNAMAPHARAQDATPPLATDTLFPVAQGRVAEFSPPSTLRLDNGKTYKLDHIRIPAPLATQAQHWVAASSPVALFSESGPATPDRHGRIAVQATADPAVWLQAGLVAQGLAWVDAPQTDSPLHARLLAVENTARTGTRGLWADGTLGLHTPETLGTLRNAFAVVSGRALDVSTQKDVIYINYGRDWKNDFTLRLTRDAAKTFPRNFAQRLKDTPVRVRGWVYERNGPMIDLTHTAQIEFLTVTESTP